MTTLGTPDSPEWMGKVNRALDALPQFPKLGNMVSVRSLQDNMVYDIREFYLQITVLESEELKAEDIAQRLRDLEEQAVLEFLKNNPTPYVLFTERRPWICQVYKNLPDPKAKGVGKAYFKICGIKAAQSLDESLEAVPAELRLKVRALNPMQQFPKRSEPEKQSDFRPPFSYTPGDDIALRMPEGYEQLFDIIRDKDGFPLIFVKQTETATAQVVQALGGTINRPKPRPFPLKRDY